MPRQKTTANGSIPAAFVFRSRWTNAGYSATFFLSNPNCIKRFFLKKRSFMVRSLNFKSVMRNWKINWNSIVDWIELNWLNCDSIELNWIVASIQFNRLRRAAIQFNRLRRAAIQFKFQLNCRLRRAAIQLNRLRRRQFNWKFQLNCRLRRAQGRSCILCWLLACLWPRGALLRLHGLLLGAGSSWPSCGRPEPGARTPDIP